MMPQVELSKIIEHDTAHYSKVFLPEVLVEFQRYVSGVLVSENKTVEGINRARRHPLSLKIATKVA